MGLKKVINIVFVVLSKKGFNPFLSNIFGCVPLFRDEASLRRSCTATHYSANKTINPEFCLSI
jgi:hypothetical protein